MLHHAFLEGQFPEIPVHMGGLGTKITHLFDQISDRSRRFLPGVKMLAELPWLSRPAKRDPEPEYQPGRIYGISSGMMSEHTVSNRFARHILPNPRNALLFIGYADPESPAGRILSASPGEAVSMNERDGGRKLEVNCRVEKFDFSGHAPRHQLLDFIVRTRPKHTVLVHGDESARLWFADQLRQLAPDMRVTIPRPGVPIDL